MNRTAARPIALKASRSPPGGEFGYRGWSMAARLAAIVTAVLLARRIFFRVMTTKLRRDRQPRQRPSLLESLPLLANAIAGSPKQTIEQVFGPPRTAGVNGVGLVVYPRTIFWQADTWYYPLPRNGLMAMAITFVDELAAKVEFFTAPHLPT